MKLNAFRRTKSTPSVNKMIQGLMAKSITRKLSAREARAVFLVYIYPKTPRASNPPWVTHPPGESWGGSWPPKMHSKIYLVFRPLF
jgi:hypothetical protein